MKKLSFAVLMLLAVPCFAASIAITGFSQDSQAGTVDGNPVTVGWEFSLPNELLVTSLGVFNTGLTESHDVGIWDAGGNLLAETTVLTSDPSQNGYLWHALTTAADLAAGTYYIGAFFDATADEYYYGSASIATDPQVTFLGAKYVDSSSLSFPNQATSVYNGRFGPNFQFDSGVPEPGSLALTLCGAILGGMALRRRRA